jgi:hypothetical protein
MARSIEFGNNGILIHLGGYNKIAQARWLVNNRNLFCTVLEAGSLGQSCPRDQVLVRVILWVADCSLLAKSSLALWLCL